MSSGQRVDLEQSILHFTEAIFLPLPRDAGLLGLNIAQIFYYLALTILFRAIESRHYEGVKYCIMYLRYLRGQWHEVSIGSGTPFPVTGTLVRALEVQVKLELEVHDMEEMAALCDDLLNSDIPMEDLTYLIMAFARAAGYRLKQPFGGQIPSEIVIDCLRKATVRLPDLGEVSNTLAHSLLTRFYLTASVDDYTEGMGLLENVIAFPDSGSRLNALRLASSFAMARYDADAKPENLEQAIHRFRALLDGSSLADPDRPRIIKQLSYLQGLRFHGSSVTADVQDVQNLLSSTSEFAKLPSFRDLTTSIPELNPAGRLSTTTFMEHFDALDVTTTSRLNDLADIEAGVKYCQELLASYPGSELAPKARSTLLDLLLRAFEFTDEIKYINEAISAARDHINTTDPLMFRVPSIFKLLTLLLFRFDLFRHQDDMNELLQLFPVAAKYEHASCLRQFPVSGLWALTARGVGHPSASTAYSYAMLSMQAALTFAPTLHIQHTQLVARDDEYQVLPLDYASYQIHAGQFKQAVETLE